MKKDFIELSQMVIKDGSEKEAKKKIMTFSIIQQQQKHKNNLSRLTKGVGEFFDEEKRVEIVYDDKDRDSFPQFKRYNTFASEYGKLPSTNSLLSASSKKELALPKTYTTRKGALILFSEDAVEEANNNFDDDSFVLSQNFKMAQAPQDPTGATRGDNQPMETVNDFTKNVLNFGIPAGYHTDTQKNENSYIKNFFLSTQRLEKESAMLKQKMEVNEEQPSSRERRQKTPKEFKKIQRGFSAKRYLNDLTKHWDQNVLQTFVTDGKIKNVEKPAASKRKMSDDLTKWPQAYRVEQNWAQTAIDMKGYKFLKASEFGVGGGSQSKLERRTKDKFEARKEEHLSEQRFSALDSYQSMADDAFKPAGGKKAKTQAKGTEEDPIKVYTADEKELIYSKLDLDEKEAVLSTLLYNSAMKNIMSMSEQPPDINYTRENPETRYNAMTEKEKSDLRSQLAFSRNDNLRDRGTFDEQIKIPESKASKGEPVYMFGKMNTMPLGKKALPNISHEVPKNFALFDSVTTSKSHSNLNATDVDGGVASKPLAEVRKSYVTHLLPTLELNDRNKIKSYQSYQNLSTIQPRDASSKSKIYNPLHSSMSKTSARPNRWRNLTARSTQSSGYRTGQLSDVAKKFENLIDDPNLILRTERSSPQITLREKSTSQLELNKEKSLVSFKDSGHGTANENMDSPNNKQQLHMAKTKMTKYGTHDNLYQPPASDMEYYGMPDDLDEQLDKKKVGSSYDSRGNMMNTDDTYKTPIEYFMEEMKSTKDEFALNSQTNSLMSFEEIGSETKSIKRETKQQPLKVNTTAESHTQSPTAELEEAKRTKNLDTHLKQFKGKSKSKSKIDLSYTENVEQKLPVMTKPQPSVVMRSKEKGVSLKEKMQRIQKSKSTLLPPIESRLETNFHNMTTDSQILFEKENSGLHKEMLNHKEQALLDYEHDFKANLKQALALEQQGNDVEDEQKEIISKQKLNFDEASSKHLPAPKFFHEEVLKQNINTDQVKRELTLEEKSEALVDTAPKLQTNYEKPSEKAAATATTTQKQRSKSKKNLVYMNDEYARVDKITLQDKKQGAAVEWRLKERSEEPIRHLEPKKAQEPEQKKLSWQEWMASASALMGGDDKNNLKLDNQKQGEQTMGTKPKIAPVVLKRQKPIDWSGGDFDPRECFLLWSYEPPPEPILVDKHFAHLLKRYAEVLAKTILGKLKGGKNLSDDIRRALKENLMKLLEQISKGKVGREVLEEYKNIFRRVLAKMLKRKDLENVEITDEMLMKLMEYPPEAFEIYLDEATGKEALRVKSSFLRELAKLVRTVVTEVALDIERDFEVYIDPVTGEKKYKMKADVAKRLGIPEGAEDMFEVYIDENGNQQIRLKGGMKTLQIGDTEYELVTDEHGNQVLRMVTKQKVGKETLEDILRLAANMTPNARNRYFQELLKTSGATMSDEMRRRIIEEMMKNAENLSAEERDNMLKNLMTNLVNVLPPDLASKVLADIMKATENMDPELKQRMIENMLNDLSALPDELRDAALKEIMKNMDNLSSEQKQKLLENILSKVEELGITSKESQDLKNQVLKEMLINAQNFDEETRQRIIKAVLEKATADGSDVPQSILEELVKQMNSLPEDMKDMILKEVKKSLEQGNLDAAVLAELMKNPENLSKEMLAAIVKNADKMDSQAMQELIKNLDKLPDDMKMEVLNKMMEGGKMDAEAMKELMRNMDKLPDAMKKQVLEKMMANMDSEGFQELMKNLDKLPDDLKRDVINKMFSNMDAGALGELVMNLDKLSDEMKNEVINKMLQNFDNLDSSVKQKLLKELLANPDLIEDKELRDKILKDIMKNLTMDDILRDIEHMTPEERNKYFQNLLKRAGDLSDEMRQKIIEMMMKNAENLSQEDRDNLMKDFMENIVKYLPPEMQAKMIADLMKSTEHLDAETKKKMINALLNNMDDLPDELKQIALGELVKNLDDLSAEDKEKIFKDILANVDSMPAEFRDKTLKAMIDNMGNFSAELKNQMLQDILDKVEASGGDSEFSKNLRNTVIKEILANSKNLDEETRKKVLKDVMDKLGDGDVPDIILEELVKQLDSLPDEYKQSVYKEIKKNIAKGNMDPNVLEALLQKGDIPADIMESLIANAKNLNPEAYAALVKNLDKLPDHLKQKALKDMLENIQNLDPVVQRELLNELLKNPNLIKNKAEYEKAILGLMDNLEGMPENVKRDMMKNIAKNLNNLSKEAKSKVLKEVFKNLENSSEETREEVLKQLLKNMGQAELEEWIKNSDMTEEEKAKMLASLKNILEGDALLWDSDDEAELAGLSPEERARKKKEILARRRKEREEGRGKWADGYLGANKTIVKDAAWLKKKQDSILKNLIAKDGPITNLDEDQIDFIKAFNKLSEEEKQKYLANLTDEQRAAILKMQETYEAIRLKELHDTLAQAKEEAIRKLREKLALKKKLDYINMFRIENAMFEHAAQITRAFVFSYFDMLQWLQPNGPTLVEQVPDNMAFPVEA